MRKTRIQIIKSHVQITIFFDSKSLPTRMKPNAFKVVIITIKTHYFNAINKIMHTASKNFDGTFVSSIIYPSKSNTLIATIIQFCIETMIKPRNDCIDLFIYDERRVLQTNKYHKTKCFAALVVITMLCFIVINHTLSISNIVYVFELVS